jgi:hypothetical protein
MRKDLMEKPEARFSEWEIKIFDAVADSMTIKDAAGKLGVGEQRLYNFFYNLRSKYYRRFSWCSSLNGQRKRGKLLKRVLTDRKHASVKRLLQVKKEEEEDRRLRLLGAEDAEDFTEATLKIGVET